MKVLNKNERGVQFQKVLKIPFRDMHCRIHPGSHDYVLNIHVMIDVKVVVNAGQEK